MKMITKTILTTLVMVALATTSLLSQVGIAPYADRSYLIKFEPGTTQAEINQAMIDLQSDEVWVSPLTGTRKWEMSLNVDFPYYNQALGIEILDINEQKEGASGRPKVDDADLNYYYTIDPLSTNPGSTSQNYCYEYTGRTRERSDIKVAILDTGFEGSSYGVVPVAQWNYVDGNAMARDFNGHGTHVFSIIESTYAELTNLHPNTISWDIRKTHDDDGYGELANIILALEEAVVDGADIINMSTSYYDSEDGEVQDMVKDVIDIIEQNNVLIVASAGNEATELDKTNGPNCFPSEFSTYNLLTVAAFDCEEQVLAEYSNYGLYSIDVTAPGNKIAGYVDSDFNLEYKSGTSQATAIVSGVAAFLGRNQTAFDYQEVKCAILSGADYKSDLQGKILTYGFINAKEAQKLIKDGCTEIIDEPGHGWGGDGRNDNTSIASSETLFPNPANNLVSLKFDVIQPQINVQIMDSRGQVLSQKKSLNSNQIEIAIDQLSSGMYFLQYETPNKTGQKTFVKI
ncbi:MAG: S8 family peptidase [Saprospiraceae bacterium]|nr:S8 family peptidase [Saprospiraceae bacterium]